MMSQPYNFYGGTMGAMSDATELLCYSPSKEVALSALAPTYSDAPQALSECEKTEISLIAGVAYSPSFDNGGRTNSLGGPSTVMVKWLHSPEMAAVLSVAQRPPWLLCPRADMCGTEVDYFPTYRWSNLRPL